MAVPYRVVYSELVRTELKALLARATQLGVGQEALDAVKEIDRRLRIYPQFGEPLKDLSTAGQTLWAAALWSLYIEYVIDEPNRAVFVIKPLRPVPSSPLGR